MAGHPRRRTQAGFTLIELLIVLGIIGTLAAIAIPNLLQAHKRSKNATALSDARNIVAATNIYIMDNNAVPGVAAYAPLYDGTAPGGTRFMARAIDPFNLGNDYAYATNGITGEIQSWSVGTAGPGTPWQAPATVGYSSVDGEYNYN